MFLVRLAPTLELESAETLQNTTLSLLAGSTLRLREVVSWVRGTLQVPVSGRFDLPRLAAISGVGIVLDTRTTFDAPQLSSMHSGWISIGTQGALNAPKLLSFTSSTLGRGTLIFADEH